MLLAAMTDRLGWGGGGGFQGGGADRRGDEGSEGVASPPRAIFTSPPLSLSRTAGSLTVLSD